MTRMSYLLGSTSKPIELGAELGKGGEGVVSLINERPEDVAKIYHLTHRTPERHAKLLAMIAEPPADATREFKPPHVSIAWPTDTLIDPRNGAFAGFVMPRIQKSPDIYKLYNPQLRAKNYPNFTWRHLHRSGINLAAALQAVHKKQVVLGDVNQKNILVTNRALVTLVDTDSFQVREPDGHVFRCEVGSPEYTPPELQSLKLGSMDRNSTHDRFGLGVLIFQLLMEGYHPFAGRPLDSSFAPDGNVYVECIRKGIFPYLENKLVGPPPHAPAFEMLHPEVQKRFIACFVAGFQNPEERPSTLDWMSALTTAENALVNCPEVREHCYSNHLAACPWCERAKPRVPAIILTREELEPPKAKPLTVTTPPKPVAPFNPVLPAQPIVAAIAPASIPRALVRACVPALTNAIPISGFGYFFIAQLVKGILALGATVAAFEMHWKYGVVVRVVAALDAYILSYKQQRGKQLAEFDCGFGFYVAMAVAGAATIAVEALPKVLKQWGFQ